ncbi:MAG TPA: methylmalonyl Co-A mutase-associated GTPase MeaB [Geminicoccaceae bacterium]|nr:methylmalonyl Co-A mutase-associated GTPase MeaB [Geminicoccus sp.]HMU51172.1 methylmalonyl Co-A mutase-associated GTPase MeaB [Geminicoccaceae bacterium]
MSAPGAEGGSDREGGVLAALRQGGKPAMARALAAVEASADGEAALALLDAAWSDPRGRIVGLTGPPGVGKSSLAASLVAAWRRMGRSVGVIAIDPSSRASGGALLGDRIRLEVDPGDDGIFVRSMAARDRLGGLAEITASAAILMAAVYRMVLVETVGVGQSETEIADLADCVVLAMQPGSGDTLQYMKAGIVEVPDVTVVTKADLGEIARRTRRELEAGLRLQRGTAAVLSVSCVTREGIEQLVAAIDTSLDRGTGREARNERWLERALRQDHGRLGLARLGRLDPGLLARRDLSPFRRLAMAAARLGG